MLFKFIGTDGSLRLKSGEYYKIILVNKGNHKGLIANIKLEDRYITCPYSSLAAFEENWELSSNTETKILNIDLGNTRGITRNLDSLGRIVIPKEFRKELNINDEDAVSIYLLENGVYISKKC